MRLLESELAGGREKHTAPESVRSLLQRSTGKPLDHATRTAMEASLGEALSQVRVHTDARAADAARAANARAYTVGQDVVFGAGQYAPESSKGRQLLAHELTHAVQQSRSRAHSLARLEVTDPDAAVEREARDAASAIAGGRSFRIALHAPVSVARDTPPPASPTPGEVLLKSFEGKFPEAANLIRKSPAAMKLVDEAAAAGAKFGGFAEDGPGKTLGRAYTSGNSVYVPKASTDKVLASRDFLFELNNAIRAPKFAALTSEAVKGTKGTLTAEQYAYKMAEQEVEGMLRLGETWFQMKKSGGIKETKYDPPFFLPDYEAVKSGKKSKDELVKEVLERKYDTGDLKGKTVKQYYEEAYKKVSGGK